MPSTLFDVSYSMPCGGRAVADTPDEMHAAVGWLEQRAAEVGDRVERARLLSLAGGYAVILRQLDRAAVLLHEALLLADEGGTTRQGLVARIRLADLEAVRGERMADRAHFGESPPRGRRRTSCG